VCDGTRARPAILASPCELVVPGCKPSASAELPEAVGAASGMGMTTSRSWRSCTKAGAATIKYAYWDNTIGNLYSPLGRTAWTSLGPARGGTDRDVSLPGPGFGAKSRSRVAPAVVCTSADSGTLRVAALDTDRVDTRVPAAECRHEINISYIKIPARYSPEAPRARGLPVRCTGTSSALTPSLSSSIASKTRSVDCQASILARTISSRLPRPRRIPGGHPGTPGWHASLSQIFGMSFL
jgi:hypothetical protein